MALVYGVVLIAGFLTGANYLENGSAKQASNDSVVVVATAE